MSDREEIDALVSELEQLVPESFDGVDVVNYNQVQDIITAIRRLEKERDEALRNGTDKATAWDAVAQARTEARNKALDEAAAQVRLDCAACSGTGHASEDAECEYCGRPMRSIIALKSKEPKP